MLTDEQWDGFSRDGFMRLGALLSPREVDDLCHRADDLATGEISNDRVLVQLDTGGA